MAAVSGAGALTRSVIENWDVEHLETAAKHFSSTAQVWEEHYTAIHQGTLAPGGTVWEGPAAEAAQESTFADLVKVRGAADRLHDASSIAANGAGDLRWAKRRVLETIIEAEDAQFSVGDDLSVSDPTTTTLMRGWEVQQAQAQELAAEIGSRAKTLTAMDKEVAGKITAALHPVRGFSFGDTEGEGERAPVVQAASYGFKTDIEANDQDPLHHHGPETVNPGGTPPNGVDPETGAHVLPGEGEDGAGMRGARPIPQNAQDTLDQVDAGKWPQSANAPGTKGGRPYENDPPPGEGQKLPTEDGSGRTITYREWDVNPRKPGEDRDSERIVTGSDGSAWYTNNHYGTFQRMR
ncbi:ribonuclease domain-containing protein [Mycolicibacterium sp. CBMA 311]|uniref:ribonuclease domain-containing protein n=1 Tax=unclassified Mycolicibacterium TaxID=2636767 RepID=UPI0035CD3253